MKLTFEEMRELFNCLMRTAISDSLLAKLYDVYDRMEPGGSVEMVITPAPSKE